MTSPLLWEGCKVLQSACLYICLSACISHWLHVQLHNIFCTLAPVSTWSVNQSLVLLSSTLISSPTSDTSIMTALSEETFSIVNSPAACSSVQTAPVDVCDNLSTVSDIESVALNSDDFSRTCSVSSMPKQATVHCRYKLRFPTFWLTNIRGGFTSKIDELASVLQLNNIDSALLYPCGSRLRRSQPATKPAILIMTSFASKAGPCCQSSYRQQQHYDVIANWAGHAQLYRHTDTLPHWSSSDDSTVHVLSILWMTSCFHIVGHMWCMARLVAEGCQSAGGNVDGQSFSASALPISLLPPTDWHPSAVSLTAHNGVWLWSSTMHCARWQSLLSSIALFVSVNCSWLIQSFTKLTAFDCLFSHVSVVLESCTSCSNSYLDSRSVWTI